MAKWYKYRKTYICKQIAVRNLQYFTGNPAVQ